MAAVGIPLLMTLCLSSGILLRYTPFRTIVTGAQRRKLLVGYAIAGVINVLVMTLVFLRHEKSMRYVEADMLVFGAVTMLINAWVIRKRIREHLFVFGLVLSCNYLVISIPTPLVGEVLSRQTEGSYYIAVGVYVLLLILFYYPIRLLLRKTVEPFLSLDNHDYWTVIWPIPLMVFLSMILAAPDDFDAFTLPHMISRATMGVLLVLLCFGVAKSYRRIMASLYMVDQLTAQKIHYAQMRHQIELTRAQNHDMKHHLAAIQHFMDTDDKQGLQEYCNRVLAQGVSDVQIPYTGNAAADGIVYHYMRQARQHKINFQYTGKIQSDGIADMDLCVLLGNALDNALAGCLTVQTGRSISLVSSREGELLSILVRNTFDGKVEQNARELLSRKRDRQPGVGMGSMKSVCRQYGGTMQVQWDDNTFTVLFLLPVQ